MFISNYTFSIEKEISLKWLQFLKANTIPAIQNTKLASQIKTFNLLTEIDNGGNTYTLQMQFAAMEDFMSFELNFKDDILAELYEPFLGKIVMFETLLEEV